MNQPPCVIFEDEHLLAVHKPAGWNTHAPDPYHGEGIYEWLRHREPRWRDLAILHRLDKETSGLLVFGKTSLANRSLTEQFTRREVHKTYRLLTDRARPLAASTRTVRSQLVRVGEKYASRPGGEPAETVFRLPGEPAGPDRPGVVLLAEPVTGRTHQIRVHAAESGFPILGDTLYGGTPAPRVYLQAAEIRFTHPATGQPITLSAPDDFAREPRSALRAAFIEPTLTDAFRLIHGAADGWPGWYVERLGDYLLSQSEQPLTPAQTAELQRLLPATGARGAHHKILSRQVRRQGVTETSPAPVLGEPAPERWLIRENGVTFELSFREGYSVGLFLDQRDNRRRLLTGQVGRDFSLPAATSAPTEWLNVFAYTCGFSVCAARAGARVTSLDLSKKYLAWGRRHFELNGLDPAAHDFIYGDAFDWMRRLAKKGRRFDGIVLDPPTFSASKETGLFRADRDYGRLVTAALALLSPGGVLLCSTNAADWEPKAFLATVAAAARGAGRALQRQHYVPQPPDFPVTRAEPAYLKTVWLAG